MRGQIKKLVGDKGFGFISPEGGANDVFFHVSSCKNASFDALREGDTVEFDIVKAEKGPRADNLRVVGK